MRPEISGSLEDRCDDIYEESGYASSAELVRDAVRHWLELLEYRHAEHTPDQAHVPHPLRWEQKRVLDDALDGVGEESGDE